MLRDCEFGKTALAKLRPLTRLVGSETLLWMNLPIPSKAQELKLGFEGHRSRQATASGSANGVSNLDGITCHCLPATPTPRTLGRLFLRCASLQQMLDTDLMITKLPPTSGRSLRKSFLVEASQHPNPCRSVATPRLASMRLCSCLMFSQNGAHFRKKPRMGYAMRGGTPGLAQSSTLTETKSSTGPM